MNWGLTLTLTVLIISVAYLEAMPDFKGWGGKEKKNGKGGGSRQGKGPKFGGNKGQQPSAGKGPEGMRGGPPKHESNKNNENPKGNTKPIVEETQKQEIQPATFKNAGARMIGPATHVTSGEVKNEGKNELESGNVGEVQAEETQLTLHGSGNGYENEYTVELHMETEEIPENENEDKEDEPEYKDEDEDKVIEEVAEEIINIATENVKQAQEETSVHLEDLKELLDVLQMAGGLLGEGSDTKAWVCQSLEDLEAPQLLKGIMRSNLKEVRDIKRKMKRFKDFHLEGGFGLGSALGVEDIEERIWGSGFGLGGGLGSGLGSGHGLWGDSGLGSGIDWEYDHFEDEISSGYNYDDVEYHGDENSHDAESENHYEDLYEDSINNEEHEGDHYSGGLIGEMTPEVESDYWDDAWGHEDVVDHGDFGDYSDALEHGDVVEHIDHDAESEDDHESFDEHDIMNGEQEYGHYSERKRREVLSKKFIRGKRSSHHVLNEDESEEEAGLDAGDMATVQKVLTRHLYYGFIAKYCNMKMH
ncbi:hypothetical protein ACHWQZ_G003253 [Mnemiopsis leidyi]